MDVTETEDPSKFTDDDIPDETTKTSFPCTETNCKKAFASSDMLASHQSRHVTTKYVCDQCLQTFRMKKDLDMHNQFVHLKSLPVVCHRCGIGITDDIELQLHTDNKCKLAKQNRRSVKTVVSTTMKKRIPPTDPTDPSANDRTGMNCAVCPRKYFHIKSLLLHYRNEHNDWDSTGEMAKICRKCYHQFDSAEESAAHFEAAHNRWQCEICKKSLICQESLDRHMKRHPNKKRPFKCELCGAQFLRNFMLQLHHRRRHTDERPFECPVCHKRFPALQEMRTHHKFHKPINKALTCAECGQRYSNDNELQKHIQLRHFRVPHQLESQEDVL